MLSHNLLVANNNPDESVHQKHKNDYKLKLNLETEVNILLLIPMNMNVFKLKYLYQLLPLIWLTKIK
jgi:hypothetical protein